MIRERTLRARQRLVSNLPITGELLRGSLLENEEAGMIEMRRRQRSFGDGLIVEE